MVQMDPQLQFSSVDALHRSGNPNNDMQRTFQSISLKLAIDKVEKILAAARTEPNLERKYSLFYRAACLCNLLVKRRDFDSSYLKPQLYNAYERSLNEVEALRSQLELLYRNAKPIPTYRAPSPPVVERPESIDERINRSDFGNFITPKQLVQYVEEARKTVLIIDYRRNHMPAVLYRDTNFIRDLPISDSLLVPGMIYNHFHMNLEVRYRHILRHINNYDLVVLMGDELADKNATPFKPSSKSKILYDALTDYNSSNRLQRKPLMLEGGFPNWEHTFPMYVHKEDRLQNFGSSPYDEFFSLVEKAREGISVGEIEYPDLLGKRLSPKKQSPIPPADFERSVIVHDFDNIGIRDEPRVPASSPGRPPVVRNVPIRYESSTAGRRATENSENSVRSSASNFSLDSLGSTQPSSRSTEKLETKPVDAPKPKPFVDRSNKPLLEGHATEFPVNIEEEPQPKKIDGGARVDTYVPQSQPGVHRRPISRPPTPDRSTKGAIDNSGQLKTLQQLYSLSVEEIRKSTEQLPPEQWRPGCTGLYNMGNTCFMNSTLQALFYTPGLANYFSRDSFLAAVNPLNKVGTKGVMTACFSAVMDVVWSGKYRAIKPDRFFGAFVRTYSVMGDRKQHDAQEFLIYLLDALHEDTNKVSSRKPFEQNYDGRNIRQHAEHYIQHSKLFSSSPIMDIFNLTTVSELRCSVCGTASVTFEEMSQISVELPLGSGCELSSCLGSHFRDVMLDGSSCWNCPKCKRPQPTTRKSKIWSLPPVLVVHMKRFSMKGGNFEKNTIHVDFDVHALDMSHYLHRDADPAAPSKYDLYAVTNHDGSLNSGHYTSFNYNDQMQNWLLFNDDVVTVVGESGIRTQKAFILYYRARRHR